MTNDAKGNFISGMARGNKSSRYRSGHSIRRFPWGICTCPRSNYSFGINGCTTTTILETARPSDRGHSGQQAWGDTSSTCPARSGANGTKRQVRGIGDKGKDFCSDPSRSTLAS